MTWTRINKHWCGEEAGMNKTEPFKNVTQGKTWRLKRRPGEEQPAWDQRRAVWYDEIVRGKGDE